MVTKRQAAATRGDDKATAENSGDKEVTNFIKLLAVALEKRGKVTWKVHAHRI